MKQFEDNDNQKREYQYIKINDDINSFNTNNIEKNNTINYKNLKKIKKK